MKFNYLSQELVLIILLYMVNYLKPYLHSYSRFSFLCWLRYDVTNI